MYVKGSVGSPTFERIQETEKKSEEPVFQIETDHTTKEIKKETNHLETAVILSKMNAQIIQEALKETPFVLSADKVKNILELTGLNIDQLLQELVPMAKVHARPPISNYFVGAVGLAKSGNIYLGVNLEFVGFQLNQTVHGEQFVVTHARNNGETELVKLALSAAPCGHCRQFLNEFGDDSDIEILTPTKSPYKLSTLLPASFGPKDLSFVGGLLTAKEPIKSEHNDPVVARAIEAAHISYAPYSESPSGVAIKTKDGKIYSGSYLENAAFNPTLPPLQVALVALVADQKQYADIVEVALVEGEKAMTRHALVTEALIKSIAPEAKFTLEFLK